MVLYSAYLLAITPAQGGERRAGMSESQPPESPAVLLLTGPRQLHLLLDLLPEAIVFVDAQGRLLEANVAAHQAWGEQLPGPGSSEGFERFEVYRPGDPQQLPRHEWPMARALRGGESVSHEELELVINGGPRSTVLFSAVPLRNEAGALLGAVGVVENVTPRRQAEQAVAARDELVAVATHELRSPLSTLQLQLQALERALDKSESLTLERLRSALALCRRQVGRLSLLTDRLLDVARLTAGTFILDLAALDLGELVTQVVSSLQEPLAAAGCTPSVHVAAPVIGTWDRLRLEQVLTNLLTNAMKYAAGTPLVLSVEPQGVQAVVVVHDHGPGIPLEARPHVFDRFRRASDTHQHHSLGLGLYVSRQIARAHGGDLTLEDAPGGGACFVLRLPLQPPR